LDDINSEIENCDDLIIKILFYILMCVGMYEL